MSRPSKARLTRAADVEDQIVPRAGKAAQGAREIAGEAAPSVIHAQFASVEPVEQTATIREVWGDAILAEPTKVQAIINAQDVIRDENRTMVGAAINMGRALAEAKLALSAEEFAKGLRESRKAWGGWTKSNVTKLIAIAEFFDRHRFTVAELPQGWTTLYEFTVLDDQQFGQARKIGLFRQDVRRNDIQAFKAKIAANGDAPEVLDRDPSSISPFEAEIDRLTLRLKRLDSEAEAVRRKRQALFRENERWHQARKG